MNNVPHQNNFRQDHTAVKEPTPGVVLTATPPRYTGEEPYRRHRIQSTSSSHQADSPRQAPAQSDGNNVLNFFMNYFTAEEREELNRDHQAAMMNSTRQAQSTESNRKRPVRVPARVIVPEAQAQARIEALRNMPMSDTPAEERQAQPIRMAPRSTQYWMTLVLDLDNTLIHAVEVPPPYESDFVIKVNHEGAIHTFYVSVRPYVGELLEYLRGRRDIEVIVFTAAKEAYGRAIVQKLDPEGTVIHHFLSEEHTTRTMGKKIKDLEKLGRPIETICIVEDNPDSYAYQKRSSFPLTRWSGNMNDDTELRDLVELLESARETGDLVGELDKFKATRVSDEAFPTVVANVNR